MKQVSPFHDTLVLCRPHQVREAAIVLSCFPGDRFTPLVVLEPPPVSEDEYRRLYGEFRTVSDQRDEAIGAELGRLEVIRGKLIPVSNAEVDRKTEALTPYRSWWRHNRLISDLLSMLPLRRVISLFEPQPQELHLINPIPLHRITDERHPIIPENLDWLFLSRTSEPGSSGTGSARHAYRSLAELTDVAWHLCRETDSRPEAQLEIPEEDVAGFLAGLFRALQLGVPLRPTGGGGPSFEDLCAKANVTLSSPGEAVLIEVSDEATNLLAVQYAHQRQAKLVLYRQPDPTPIEAALTNMQRQQEEAAEFVYYLAVHRDQGLKLADLNDRERSLVRALPPTASPGSDFPPFDQRLFLKASRQFLVSDWAGTAIRQIEAAVSDLVPDKVVDQVGDLGLTAFTSGVPYNFVKKNGVDWSRKPVGHIAGDASLVMFTELCRPGPGEGIGFNLIFDPGFFQTPETQDVLGELSHRVSYSLLLSGDTGSSGALIHLSATLPLEVVFFNTHGSDREILLSDMALPNYKLVQRVNLRSHPIVFNSSCLSWIGVGREFIRVGARAYIGTLWSVNANLAAKYAQVVLNRLAEGNLPVSQAMRNTGLDLRTEQAYIFIGTCSARLAEPPPEAPGRERLRISFARFLFSAALDLVRQTEGRLPFMTSLEDLLIAKAAGQISGPSSEPSLELLDLIILYLNILSYLVDRRRGEIAGKIEVLNQTIRGLLDALQLDEQTHFERLSQWQHFSGRIYMRLGQIQPAIDFLSKSVQAASKASESPGPQYLELSDAYKIAGRLPEALDMAVKAKEAYETDAKHPSPGVGQLYALGRLSQISMHLQQYEMALSYAQEGFSLATTLDHLGEQFCFKGDEARAYMGLKDFDRALEAANESLQLARQTHDDLKEVNAYGNITRALIGKGDLSGALAKANIGLHQARRRAFWSEAGDFLNDIAEIKARSNDFPGALEALLEAIPILTSTGQAVKMRRSLALASDLRARVNSLEAIFEMAMVEVNVIDALEFDLRRQITMDLITQVKGGILRAGLAAVHGKLHDLAGIIATQMDQRGGEGSDQMKFIAMVLQMFDEWASGRQAAAQQAASRLDDMSGGGFELVKFLQSLL